MNEVLSYKDVALVPKYSKITSRSRIDTSTGLGKHLFKSPVIPANMKCCINIPTAINFARNKLFYVLHRFYKYDAIYRFVEDFDKENLITSISVGVKSEDKKLLYKIKHNNLTLDYVTIDVAHGDHKLVHDMVKYIKDDLKLDTFVIAGNIGTVEAGYRMEHIGVDAVKVGLSMGKACTTYNVTGVGTPMFSTVKEIAERISLPIIADGQIREVGDVCKALAAGADMVMIGSMFAACKDSPAPPWEEVIGKYYFGNASRRNKEESEEEAKYIEGDEKVLDIAPYSMLEFVDICNQGVQSCCSYGGYGCVHDLSKYGMEYRILK